MSRIPDDFDNEEIWNAVVRSSAMTSVKRSLKSLRNHATALKARANDLPPDLRRAIGNMSASQANRINKALSAVERHS